MELHELIAHLNVEICHSNYIVSAQDKSKPEQVKQSK
jgi:hypothetical protein